MEEGRKDLARIQTALPDYSHEADFVRWGRRHAAGLPGSFIDYKKEQVNGRRRGAVVMLVLGGSFFIGVIACFPIGADGIPLPPLFAVGGVSLVSSAVLLSVGGVRMSRTKKMLKGLETVTAVTDAERKRSFTVRPFVAREGQFSSIGISGSFSF